MQSVRSWIAKVLVFSMALCTTTLYSHTVKTKSPTNKTVKKKCTTCCTKKTKNQKTKGKRKKKKKKGKKQPVKSERKTLSYLNYEELEKEKNRLLAKGYKEIAIKYLTKMVPLCTDLEALGNLMLELADLHFDIGQLNRAENLYTEFVRQYPGHTSTEYASYKSILCSFWATLDSDRDQSTTKETIERATTFLERKKVFRTYTNQVTKILTSCREKLLESEINIFNFYTKRGDYRAAKTRLENIEKEFLPLLPEKELLLLTLACDLAEKQQDQKLLKAKRMELAKKFPEYGKQPNLVVTQKAKRSAMNKF